MVKKLVLPVIFGSLFLWSCATYQPPPPNFYIGNLPGSIVAEMSLEERLLTEDAWNNLREGKAEKARKLFAELGIQSPGYHSGLGYVYYLLEQPDLAEEYFKASLERYPEMTISRIGLVQIYLDRGQEEDAFIELREIMKTEPEHPWAKPRHENIKLKKTEEAIFMGKSLLEQGNYEKGKSELLKALFYSPDSREAHLALAEIYKSENEIETALMHLKSVLDNDPDNTEILRDYGELLFLAEENKESLEVFEKLQESEPDNQSIRQRIETLKNRLGIFELPSQYNAIPSREAISKEELAALIAVKFKGILDKPSGKPPIIVDITTSWATQFILDMTSIGILDVYPNHTFQPKKTITRGEMAEVLFRLTNYLRKKGIRLIQQIPPEKIQIKDVSPDNFYHRPILLVISYDLMSLYPDRTFRPDLPVSGVTAIKFLDLIISLSDLDRS